MIKPLLLSELCARFGGELVNGDASFSAIATDSRKQMDAALFVAIRGENFDAHDYLDQAIENGAIALLVNKAAGDQVKKSTVPTWLVDDSILALGHIARAQRDHYQGILFAITGSNGKTSVKGMLENILCAAAGKDKVFATKGNLNNHLGVPFSLLAMNAQCQYAVIEMGASALGEIDYLSHIAQPHFALVNNVSPVHVEGFGSVDNIALAKSEIYDHLLDSGAAIINADDHYSPQWLTKNTHRKNVTFSAKKTTADVFVSDKYINNQHCYRFLLSANQQHISVQLNVLGEHAVMNAAAAASLALAANIELGSIKVGLESFVGVSGRLQVSQDPLGNTLIDDTYNASPKSMRAAIDVLADFDEQKILVIGDMGELGEAAAQQHESIGRYAKEKNITRLYGLGELSKHAVAAFGENAYAANTIDEMMGQVGSFLTKPSCVLVKGSRSAKMERVIHYLKQSGETDASLVS